jgi:hypothetical protein
MGFVRLLCVALLVATSSVQAVETTTCDGPWRGKAPPDWELHRILSAHARWLEYSRDADTPDRADLCEAILSGISLQQADLRDANLARADLRMVNLQGSVLTGANLEEADMRGAILDGARMRAANLKNAKLLGASLDGTKLTSADLRHADFRGAILRGAELDRAMVGDARFETATLEDARYEVSGLPEPYSLSGIRGLAAVRVTAGHEDGLVLLRSALRDVGLRELERQATYAIERARTNDKKKGPLERWTRQILFDWTSRYGMRPGRPLLLMGVLLCVCILPYAIATSLHPPIATSGAGIFKWEQGHIELGPDGPSAADGVRVERLRATPGRALVCGLHFSLYSAFHFGWRDLNVGTWLARMQSREYALRATGWVRTLSGVQSLISVYLVALSAFSYFGRPFG